MTDAVDLLHPDAILLNERADDRDGAIRRCGEALLAVGAIEPAYAQAMLERERSVSTYVGEEVAIPHGTLGSKSAILRDTLAVLRFPDGVDWGGQPVRLCVAIAVSGEGHLDLLAQLAEILSDPDRAAALRAATDVDQVRRLLTPEPA